MATRSRLGRDPLQGAATPPADQPAKAPRQSPAAGQSPRKTGGARPKTRPTTATPDPVAGPRPAEATGGPAGQEESQTIMALSAASPGGNLAPVAAQVPSPAAEPVPPAAVVPTAPAQTAETAAPTAPCPSPTPLPLDQGAHPVEVFLRGVLEGLLPEGEAALCVAVDPETFSLPVEKLFYFSHALQRIVTPLERSHGPDWRPGDAASPLPVLTVRLQALGGGRHGLTLTDNGQFFRSRLAGLSLGMEALRPLVAFIVKRHGSVRLAQGRCVSFEIIG